MIKTIGDLVRDLNEKGIDPDDVHISELDLRHTPDIQHDEED